MFDALNAFSANAAKEFHKRVPRFFGVLVVYEKLYGVHNGQDEGAQWDGADMVGQWPNEGLKEFVIDRSQIGSQILLEVPHANWNGHSQDADPIENIRGPIEVEDLVNLENFCNVCLRFVFWIIFSERLNSYSVLSTKECHDEETRIDKHSHQRNNNYIEVLQEVCSSCLDEDDSDSDFIPQTIGESCVHEGNHEKDSTQKDATSSPD